MERQHRNPPNHVFSTVRTAAYELQGAKKQRGSYNCGRCGLPKKGHVCHVLSDASSATPSATATTLSHSAVRPPLAPSRLSHSRLRRALSFGDAGVACESFDEADLDADLANLDHLEVDLDPSMFSGGLPAGCLWEVLRRLQPVDLLSAAGVCKGWREITRRLWKAAEELRIRVPARAQVGNVGSLLQKCSGLSRLSLNMESDVDATMLACIAFSCPSLKALEISVCKTAVNRITGDELSRFVVDKRCLTSLKMEGCSNFGWAVLCSPSLSKLWLSELCSLSKMVFNCPNLREISLEFTRHESDTTDLTKLVDGLGRNCPNLQNVHIASLKLSHAVVLALTAANFRGLQMLSLVLGSGITDASIAAITSSYSKLEMLDLSGSSISDSGLGIICNILPNTLSMLLLSLCPNITSSGIQFATAQLPLLELMDCGMTICGQSLESTPSNDSNNNDLQKKLNNTPHIIYQKLIIKHSRLKKLSLWGCSGLDALFLNCPELLDLNLNLCENLNPERLVLQCENVEKVHASGCKDLLIGAIKCQVSGDSGTPQCHLPSKRLADGSKRISAPTPENYQHVQEDRKRKRQGRQEGYIVVD